MARSWGAQSRLVVNEVKQVVIHPGRVGACSPGTAPLPVQGARFAAPQTPLSLTRINFGGTSPRASRPEPPTSAASRGLLGAPNSLARPPHLSRVLLAHEPRGRLLGQAALVQPQPLHVAVGGDALRLRGALHLLNLHLADAGSQKQRGNPTASTPRPAPGLPCGSY